MNKRASSQGPARGKSSATSRSGEHRGQRGQTTGGAGRLRIIGGRFKRRLLTVIDAPGLRPTPDRVRETLYNWLGAHVADARVLDLFAGSGALGLEALSREAAHVTFVERENRVARALQANIDTLAGDTTLPASVSSAEVMHWLETVQPPQGGMDLVLLDPPFRLDLAASSCALLEARHWLSDDAMIYLEVESGLEPTVPANWQLHRESRAGDSHGRLYQRYPPA
ncbi:16S rRNA (guanine(966)-N(2))-methyltransferase RsmD [Cobetia sp. L2A1]|jgi:16S rRNA (guanine966-N2)-methyltransferase|uniref:16S rRNA (guanine(966)-N(2))-methyltransferase RsmD n=1 Tax=Cobetia sp. L2A1 TaxID=2686360 RepID=UPI00131E30E1|nr:16S rRNA (guanine(966)-N(2))-methyltransferase RsmD [Cobetia sp. L2A1]